MSKASVQGAAVEGQFDARIEAVRRRFVASFANRMQRTAAALPQMIGDGTASAETVASAYRWLHEVCGIASTIGFQSTGQSARSCDALLIGPYRTQRGLSAAELAQLSERLESLRLAARAEMQIPESSRG
jgi:hypothetical protein